MATTNIQILSDLHLESPSAYDVYEITPTAPHLALLGDIGNTNHPDLFQFLQSQLSKFETVFFLLGNHEPYHSDWASAKKLLSEFEQDMNERRTAGDKGIGRFVLLDQTRYDLPEHDVTILGCTLYSRITPAQDERVSFGLNDFYHIADWTTQQHNDAHANDLARLNLMVEDIAKESSTRRIAIFTHHCPTLDKRTVDPAHLASPISSGFSTDLSKEICWESSTVVLWAFGHTHYNCDFKDEGTGKRVVANQRGCYFAKSIGFEPDKIIGL